jgi:predicted MFS family arabinose efflux permease
MEDRRLEEHLIAVLSKGRFARILVYSFIFLGGVFSLIAPSEVMQNSANDLVVKTCSIIWLIGGGVSLIGTLLDHWAEERVMIPLLIPGVVIFAGALFFQSGETGLRLIPYGFMFLVIPALLWYRYEHVKGLLEAQQYMEGRHQ